MAEALRVEERFKTLQSTAEECIGGEEELRALLDAKPSPICFHSFDPSGSGRVDIAQGVGNVISVNKMIRAGCRVKILIEDQRTGGDSDKIRAANLRMIEVWKALGMELDGAESLTEGRRTGGDSIRAAGLRVIEVWKALGMDLDGVEFLWSSEETNKRAHEYWPLVMDIARESQVRRLASLQPDPENVMVDQLWEPIMQCADILFSKADICQMGMDQREVNMMATEYCEHNNGKSNKPVFLLHHMLRGFKEGQQKMSKSDPSSAIFMDDSEVAVKSKIKKAFCPIKITQGNPCLEYIEHIVFPWFGKFEVFRKENHGGNRTYIGMEELLVDYSSGALHPGDVKLSLGKAINQILQPVRDHFEKIPNAEVLCNVVKAVEQPR